MRLSVIIPVYDRQAPGERALRSVLAQDVDRMEVIIVDDHSPSPFRLAGEAACDPRVRVLRHQSNRGAGAARDTGFAESLGEWIAFLDSDDVWLPGTLAPRLAFAESEFAASRDSMVAYAAGFLLDRTSSGRRETRIPLGSADIADFVSGCWFAPGSTALLRREALARVGANDPALRRLEDFDWFIRFALQGGRLAVWPHVAARVEVARKPGAASAVRAISHLRAKYVQTAGPLRLAPDMINRLEAYFDLEMASNLSADGRWPSMVFHLARSFWRVPRASLQVRRLCSRTVVPAQRADAMLAPAAGDK